MDKRSNTVLVVTELDNADPIKQCSLMVAHLMVESTKVSLNSAYNTETFFDSI